MTLTRTRVRDLLLPAVAVGAVAFVASTWWVSTGRSSSVPWIAPITLLGGGIALIVSARSLRHRVGREAGDKRLPALVAARWVALALAASRTGAAVAAAYVGWWLAIALDGGAFDTDFGRERTAASAAAVVGAVLVMVGGLLLERTLALPDEPKDDLGSRP